MLLPPAFAERMKIQLGSEAFQEYEKSLDRSLSHALRVNRLKLTSEELLAVSPFALRPIPWCENGFYYDASKCSPSKDPAYYAGLYYLQEPSATLPAALLPVTPGDRVLDLCAAPGGKSTELAAKLGGSGFLLANDISATRCKALIKNLELFGVKNAVVTAETPQRLAQRFPSFFDKILIDAPCSGEGMFRKSAAMVNDWTPDKPAEYAALQREILDYAVHMLRPGGMILYSTCTFSPEEDEGSVQALLDMPEAKEKGLFLKSIPDHPGFFPGRPDWISSRNDDLRKTVHLFPHMVEGEGHFAALLASQPDDTSSSVPSVDEKKGKNSGELKKISPEFAAFAENLNLDLRPEELVLSAGYLSLVPRSVPDLKGLRVMRRGLFLGEVKKNRFEPSQALAMTLSPDTFKNTLSLSPGDERIIRYLKGETIFLTEEEEKLLKNGWLLIALDRYPLGFGKLAGGSVKNRYLTGWRME